MFGTLKNGTMSKDYKSIPTPELERMWNEKRLSIRIGKYFQEDMNEVYAMRKELDRRAGNEIPPVFVNFEKENLTD